MEKEPAAVDVAKYEIHGNNPKELNPAFVTAAERAVK
jgi:hypothetical protein